MDFIVNIGWTYIYIALFIRLVKSSKSV